MGSGDNFAALIDTGGPITTISKTVLRGGGGSPIELGTAVPLRLAGRSYEAPLYEISLEVRNPRDPSAVPIEWRRVVAVLDPWPHQGTAIILGQSGFLANFTVTFGPEGFSIEEGDVFAHRYTI